MRKNELHEAMEHMHASEDTYERVMERAQAGRRRSRRGPLPAAAVMGAAMAGVLVTGGVAYAVSGGDIFSAWGDHGMGERVELRGQ